MPKLQELKAKYKDRGLRTVAVHMPRYEADTDLEKVKQSIAEHCIDDVCAIDNEHKLKDAFLNEQGWVPVYYLFDSEGKLKSRAAGEFGIGVIRSLTVRLGRTVDTDEKRRALLRLPFSCTDLPHWPFLTVRLPFVRSAACS
jgi:hypothetical protein